MGGERDEASFSSSQRFLDSGELAVRRRSENVRTRRGRSKHGARDSGSGRSTIPVTRSPRAKARALRRLADSCERFVAEHDSGRFPPGRVRGRTRRRRSSDSCAHAAEPASSGSASRPRRDGAGRASGETRPAPGRPGVPCGCDRADAPQALAAARRENWSMISSRTRAVSGGGAAGLVTSMAVDHRHMTISRWRRRCAGGCGMLGQEGQAARPRNTPRPPRASTRPWEDRADGLARLGRKVGTRPTGVGPSMRQIGRDGCRRSTSASLVRRRRGPRRGRRR